MIVNTKPELLSPAGSMDTLLACVSAGCDAVYVGMKDFSARAYAQNFDNEEIDMAILYCHLFNVKIYVAINVQIYDKEFKEAVKLIEDLWEKGVDGFIVSNIGLAYYIHKNYPEIILHASTQCTGQNTFSSEFLKDIGFTRMVAPREVSYEDLKILTKKSCLDIEVFIHGALCVCHSGQCLLSYMLGGRSGNRGECAQPCRMEYEGKNKYPLSLKDLNYASHMKEILSLGISSLKIEGRMKGVDYVYAVTKIYRKLIDENRNATKEELETLYKVFSRSGFTDGYFTKKVDSNMNGIRTKEDKDKSNEYSQDVDIKKLDLKLYVFLHKNEPSYIKGTFSIGGVTHELDSYGELVQESKNRPLSIDDVKKQILKLGNTYYRSSEYGLDVDLDENVYMNISSLNDLRRALIEKINEYCQKKRKLIRKNTISLPNYSSNYTNKKISYFLSPESISNGSFEYFDNIFVNMCDYDKTIEVFNSDKIGCALPPVILENELDDFVKKLEYIKQKGCKSVLVTNTSQIYLSKKHGFDIFLGHRINVFNKYDALVYSTLGVKNIVFSLELGLNQIRDIPYSGNKYTLTYGHMPLMTLEKCVIKEILGINNDNCNYCKDGKITNLKDKTKAEFLVYGFGEKFKHRNILYNSVPLWMADKTSEMKNFDVNQMFFFTYESKDECDDVISKYKNGTSIQTKFRRVRQ